MKITLENPSRMVLDDNNYTIYLWGVVCFMLGAWLVFLAIFGSLPLVVGLIGAILALLGIWMVLSNQTAMITLDKSTGRGSIALRGLMKSESRDMDLGDIKKLILERPVMAERHTGSHPFVEFVMDRGEAVSFKLTNVYAATAKPVPGPDKEEQFVQRIADFLGVPMEATGPRSTPETASDQKEKGGKMSKAR